MFPRLSQLAEHEIGSAKSEGWQNFKTQNKIFNRIFTYFIYLCLLLSVRISVIIWSKKEKMNWRNRIQNPKARFLLKRKEGSRIQKKKENMSCQVEERKKKRKEWKNREKERRQNICVAVLILVGGGLQQRFFFLFKETFSGVSRKESSRIHYEGWNRNRVKEETGRPRTETGRHP